MQTQRIFIIINLDSYRTVKFNQKEDRYLRAGSLELEFENDQFQKKLRDKLKSDCVTYCTDSKKNLQSVEQYIQEHTFPELFFLPEELSRCWFFSELCPERLSFDRELEEEVRGLDRFLRSCDDINNCVFLNPIIAIPLQIMQKFPPQVIWSKKYHILPLNFDKIILETFVVQNLHRTRHFVTWKPRGKPRSGASLFPVFSPQTTAARGAVRRQSCVSS